MRRVTAGLALMLLCAACHHEGAAITGDDLGVDEDLGTDTPDLAGGGFVEVDGGLVACATDTQKATLKPLDIYLMVDSSGSMTELTGGASSPSKWAAVSAAINAFASDPTSSGIGIALQFFPIIAPGSTPMACASDASCGAFAPCINNKACAQNGAIKFCSANPDCPSGVTCAPVGTCSKNSTLACFSNGGPGCGSCNFYTLSYCSGRDSCTATAYQAPAVAFGTLPAAAASISSALSAHMPDGFTPTAPALRGAVDAATAQAAANPGHVVVAVLATDGFPTECTPQDIPSIAAIASSGTSAMPAIKTFVIGVFSTAEQAQATTNLNQIAAAAGTSNAFVISTTSNVSTAFQTALNQIRGASLPCDYALPVPASGTPDYEQVNVQFTNGATSKIVPGTSGLGACDPMLGGWYYDIDPKAGIPTRVVLCPKSCDVVKADASGQIDIVQGCATVIL